MSTSESTRPGYRLRVGPESPSRVSCGFLTLALGVLLALPTFAGSTEVATGCSPFLFELQPPVDFRHQNGASVDPQAVKHLPETMGAGIAFFDYDGDGDDDLYLVQSGSLEPTISGDLEDRLYRNLGQGEFELDEQALVGLPGGYGQGVLAFDRDGDKDLDLILTRYGNTELLDNDGRGHFSRVTEGALPRPIGRQRPWGSSIAAGDIDADGDLDLYVTQYLAYDTREPVFCGDEETGVRAHCDPSLFAGLPDVLLSNRGDGTFEQEIDYLLDSDTTDALGARTDALGARTDALGNKDEHAGRGLGVLLVDLDGDRLVDIYVANDLMPNYLLRNIGSGKFEDVSLASGAGVDRNGRPQAGMGLAVADVDLDGDPDLAVTNFDVETNTLYQNRGGLYFRDVSAQSGLGLPSFNFLGFGLLARDFDLDGDVDFYVANGHIFEQPARSNVSHQQPDQLFEGLGGGRFRVVECAVLTSEPRVSRGAASADWDLDGDLDVATNNNGDVPTLLENVLENVLETQLGQLPGAAPRPAGEVSGSWLGVTLVGSAPNTEAIGAVVSFGTKLPQRRFVVAGDSYQSSSSRSLRFAADARQDDESMLEVVWPDGSVTRIHKPEANHVLRITKP